MKSFDLAAPLKLTGTRYANQLIQLSNHGHPYAQSLLSIAVIVLEKLDTCQAQSLELTELREQVLELINIIPFDLDNLKTGELVIWADKVLGTLERLSRDITRLSMRSKLGRFLTTTSTDRALKQTRDDLDFILTVYSTKISMSNRRLTDSLMLDVAELQRALEMASKDAADAHSEYIRARVIEQSQRHDSQHSIISQYDDHPFLGREGELSRTTDMLCNTEPTFIAVLGPGGIGKTSLALSCIGSASVVEAYGCYRYFIACDAIFDADGFSSKLAKTFNLPEKWTLLHLKRFVGGIQHKALLVVDNLETIWEPRSLRADIESILLKLSNIPNLSIMVTLRGAERPLGVPWTRPCLRPLQPLQADACKEVFRAIADMSSEDDDVDRVLDLLGGIPLAITLMAKQARFTTCQLLLQRWADEKTSMLSDGQIGADHRLSSLDLSISLSLASERFRSNGDALLVLQVLSILPDGATIEDLGFMSISFIDILMAVSILHQVALTYLDAQGRICTCSPIREYVQSRLPIHPAIFTPIFLFYAKFAERCRVSKLTADKQGSITAMHPRIGNLHSVIRRAFSMEDLRSLAIQAVIDLADYHAISSPGPIRGLLEVALTASESGNLPILKADCLHILARYEDRPALVHFETAAKVFRDAGEEERLWSCLLEYAELLCARQLHRESQDVCREVVEKVSLTQTPNTLGILSHANVTWSQSLYQSSDIVGSLSKGQEALRLARETNCGYLLSLSWEAVALAMGHSGKFLIAEQYLRSGLNESDEQSKGYSTGSLADNLFIQSRISEAKELYLQAFDYFAAREEVLWLANVQISLGRIALALCEYDEAMKQFQLSLRVWEKFKIDAEQARCVAAIGEVQLARGNHTTAWAHFCEARKLYRAAKETGGNRDYSTLFPMGDILYASGNPTEAVSYYVIGISLCRKTSNLLGLAQGLQRIGDCFYASDPPDLIGALACYQTVKQTIRGAGTRRHAADCEFRLAIVSYRLTDVDVAFEYLENAVRFYKDAADKVGAARAAEILESWYEAIDTESGVFQPLPLATTIMYL